MRFNPPPSNNDDTEIFEMVEPIEPHKHRASCFGAIGELQCDEEEPGEAAIKKVDKAGPIIATALVFIIIGAFVISLAIWGLVSIWRAILG